MPSNNIKSERVRIDLTQEELAPKIGVDSSTIRRWEKGKSNIPSSAATLMSKLFNCSIDYLFGLSNERTKTGYDAKRKAG